MKRKTIFYYGLALTLLLLGSFFSPLIYSQDPHMQLLNDITDWTHKYLEDDISVSEFYELMGDDTRTAFSREGFVDVNAKRPLLDSGYLKFSTPKKDTLGTFRLRFTTEAKVTLKDIRKLGSPVLTSKIDENNTLHEFHLEEVGYRYIGLLTVDEEVINGEKKITAMSVSRIRDKWKK